MKSKKLHKIPDIYLKSKEAMEFLEKYPEFNDRFLTQTEVAHPGFNTAKGRYTLHDVSEEQKQYGELMVEAIRLMPEGAPKALLEAYYEGATHKALKDRFKIKNNNVLDQRIWRAKRQALKNMVRCQNVRIKDQTPLATRAVHYNGQTRFVYLVRDEITQDSVWVRETGEVLPDYAQQILDEHPDFKEWDVIFL